MTKKQNNFYTKETKLKAIEMKLQGFTVKQIMKALNIKSESQVYAWYYWY